MRKITEVLRLKAAGISIRDIALSVGAGRTTIFEYLARAEAAGLAWPLPEGLDEAALEAKLFPPPCGELAARRPVPEWREVHRELKRGRHVTLRLLWLEWREDHPEGWGYSQFCLHYQRWLAAQDVVMRLTYAAGRAHVRRLRRRQGRLRRPRHRRGRARPRCSWPCSGPAACSTPRRPGARTSPLGGRPCPRLGVLWRRGRGHRARQPAGRGDQGVLV